MYHISNYGFADPDYMEHYGVKNMRWRKRRARYGIDARRYLDKGKDDIAGRMARGGPSGNPGSEYGSYLAGTQKPIRNPQKTDRREYGANRRAQARTSTAKSDRMAPLNMMVRRMDRQGGGKALGNREFDSLKNWMPKSRGRAEQPWSMDRWTQERYSRPNNGRRRRR